MDTKADAVEASVKKAAKGDVLPEFARAHFVSNIWIPGQPKHTSLRALPSDGARTARFANEVAP